MIHVKTDHDSTWRSADVFTLPALLFVSIEIIQDIPEDSLPRGAHFLRCVEKVGTVSALMLKV